MEFDSVSRSLHVSQPTDQCPGVSGPNSKPRSNCQRKLLDLFGIIDPKNTGSRTGLDKLRSLCVKQLAVQRGRFNNLFGRLLAKAFTVEYTPCTRMHRRDLEVDEDTVARIKAMVDNKRDLSWLIMRSTPVPKMDHSRDVIPEFTKVITSATRKMLHDNNVG